MLIYANLNDVKADAICLELDGIKCESLLQAAILSAGESIQGFSKDNLYDYLAFLGGDVTSNFIEKLNEAVDYVKNKEEFSCHQKPFKT